MSNFIPEGERISNELAESWQRLTEKTTSLNRINNIITTLAEKGYIIQIHKENINYTVELLIRYYVGDIPDFHSAGFIGLGDDLEAALGDLVSDDRLDLGEIE